MLKVNGNLVFDEKDLNTIITTTKDVGDEQISKELSMIADPNSIKLVKIGYEFACKMFDSMIKRCVEDNTPKIDNIDAPEAIAETVITEADESDDDVPSESVEEDDPADCEVACESTDEEIDTADDKKEATEEDRVSTAFMDRINETRHDGEE